MTSSIGQQRVQDLEENISEDYKLLKSIEDTLRYERDPLLKARYRADIKRIKASVNAYRQEIRDLRAASSQLSLGNSKDFNTKLSQIENKLDLLFDDHSLLLDGQHSIQKSLQETRQTLLSHYDESEIVIVSLISDQLNQRQLELANILIEAFDKGKLLKADMQEITPMLEAQTAKVLKRKAVSEEIIKLPELDATHRLKVTLPIIPFIIDYEGELDLSAGIKIRELWNYIVKKLKN